MTVAAAVFLTGCVGCSGGASGKPANAPASADEKPLEMQKPGGGDRNKARRGAGFKDG